MPEFIQHKNFRLADLQYTVDTKVSRRIFELQKSFKQKFNFEDQKKIAFSHKVDYVYNTVALEGNTYTYIEAETLLSGVTVGGHTIKEENEILDQKEAWEFVLNNAFAKTAPDINADLIKDIHWRVGKETVVSPGQYRTGRVKIGGTNYIPPKTQAEINALLNNFLTDFINLKEEIYIKGIIIHFIIALLQPFYDGNKRTARLLMNYVLLQNNYPLFAIPVKVRQEYIEAMIQGYETLNIDKLARLLSSLIIKNLEEYNEMK